MINFQVNEKKDFVIIRAVNNASEDLNTSWIK